MTRYRTYDDWKLASPDDEADDGNTGFGTCDCCGERLPLAMTRTPLGHETWECKECCEQAMDSAEDNQ
jgi:hypothetical protein